MRGLITFLTPLVTVSLLGCEDGPNQTFAPAKGTLFNNGDTPASVNDAGDPFGSTYGGTNRQQICSGNELQAQWGRMIDQPVAPPRYMAGLDLAGGDAFPGLKVEQAEFGPTTQVPPTLAPGFTGNAPTRLCQPTVIGPGANSSDVGGSILVQWGNNGEFQMEWAVPTHKAYSLNLNSGYTGHMVWTFTENVNKGDGKKHSYDWQIGRPILRDNQPYAINWEEGPDVYNRQADTLYRGIASTFAADVYDNQPDGVTCDKTGTCFARPDGGDGSGRALFGMRPASFYIWFNQSSLPQPSGSTVNAAYSFNIKYAPYSGTSSYFKLDAEGPYSGGILGDTNKKCRLSLGGTFQDLLQSCIRVFGSAQTNSLALNKVLGNLSHDDQSFTFSVVGINQNYRLKSLDLGGARALDVIHDNESPMDDPANNFADDFQSDVRSFGPILNDYFVDAKGVHKDFHGAGAIWKEWGRLVQGDLAAKYHEIHPSVPIRSWHDPSCLFPATLPAGFDPNGWRPAEGCTGFEGLITAAEPLDLTKDPPVNDPNDVWDVYGTGLAGVTYNYLKPGFPGATFCNDPGTYHFCGLSGDLIGSSAQDMLGMAEARVLQYLGRGDGNNLPTEGRDRRYFFKQWTIAYAKYMTSPQALKKGSQNPGAPEPVGSFQSAPFDADNLIFDSYGNGASRSEYIDFDFADATHDPISLEQKILLSGSNLQSTHFYRRLDREERALFNALAIDKTTASWAYLPTGVDTYPSPSGAGTVSFKRRNANMFLSNVAGSPALQGAGLWNPVPLPKSTTGALVASTGCTTSPAPAGCGDPSWVDPCAPGATPATSTKTAYYCATHADPDCATSGRMAPQDAGHRLLTRENGKPLLEGYCGAWQGTAFALGRADTNFQVMAERPDESEAVVSLPGYLNPYDGTTKNTPITVLVPWKPRQEGVGFPVAASGTRDVFVETAQLDFAGQVETTVLDFLPVPRAGDPDRYHPMPPYGIAVQAIETEDFLGDVFLCVDPVTTANGKGTGIPGDILAAHLYTSAASIVEWIAAHPKSQDNCGLIVRYSPYNNYPDYVQSSVNGVRLGIEQGAGFGRVSDATVFVPGVGQTVAP